MHARKIYQILLCLFIICLGIVNSSCTESTNANSQSQNTILDPDNGGVHDGEKNVSTTPLVVIKFNQKIDPNTVNEHTVTMEDSNGHMVELDNLISNDDNTVFYASPEQELAPHTEYKIAVSNMVHAQANGEAMGQSFMLTTGESAIPQVGMISPEQSATKVAQNPVLFFKFSSKVNNVNSDNVVVYRGSVGGTIVPLEDIVAGANNTYAVTPKINLGSSVRYYVEFRGGITNESGVAIESRVYTFQMADMAPPGITELEPSNGAKDVSRIPTIMIKFHETAYGMNQDNVSLRKGSETGESVVISNIEAGNNATYTFSPLQELSDNTTYYIVIKANSVCDIVGNCTDKIVKSFTTGDFATPTATILAPSNNATNVSKSQIIKVKFSEQVTNVTESTVELRESSETGSIVTTSEIVGSADNDYTFSASNTLKEGSKYFVVLTSGIKDLANKDLARTVFSFTTGDFTKPTVSVLEPVNNAMSVSTNPTIKLNFSEEVLNVNSTNVELRSGSQTGTLIAISSITKSGNTYTFSPTSGLALGTQYYIILKSGIKDIAGNSLANTVSTFSTGDLVAPTVSLVSPLNNSTSVSVNPSIKLQFSESVLNVNTTNAKLYRDAANGTLVPISNPILGSGNSYTFSPSQNLWEGVTYYLVLGDGITDLSGNKLVATTYNFTVAKGSAPKVIAMSPSNGATNVAIDTSIIDIRFNESLTNANTSTIKVFAGAESWNQVQFSIAGMTNNIYRLSIPHGLAPYTKFFVVIDGVKNASNVSMAKTVLSFTTEFNGKYNNVFLTSRNKKVYRCKYDGTTILNNCVTNTLPSLNASSNTIGTVMSYDGDYVYLYTTGINASTSAQGIYKCTMNKSTWTFSSCVQQTAAGTSISLQPGSLSMDGQYLYSVVKTTSDNKPKVKRCVIAVNGDLSNCIDYIITTDSGVTDDKLTKLALDFRTNSLRIGAGTYGAYWCDISSSDGGLTNCRKTISVATGAAVDTIAFNPDLTTMYATMGSVNGQVAAFTYREESGIYYYKSTRNFRTGAEQLLELYGMGFIADKTIYGFNTRAMVCDKSSPDDVFAASNCNDIPGVESQPYEWISTY